MGGYSVISQSYNKGDNSFALRNILLYFLLTEGSLYPDEMMSGRNKILYKPAFIPISCLYV